MRFPRLLHGREEGFSKYFVTIQLLIADYGLPPGNAERLLGTVSANQQETGADGTHGQEYNDTPFPLPERPSRRSAFPEKDTSLCRIVMLKSYKIIWPH
jgi:hypothetical protein